MVLPIGFFAPLPLAIMIPFMAAQSFAMGQAFGTSFQYGKRKISSMSNEEFNAYTPLQAHEEIQADIRAMIPSLNKSFERMESFQIDIINSMVDTIKLGLDELGKWIAGGFGVDQDQTDTSLIDVGSGGEVIAPPITQIQGGDRNTETILERQTRQEQDRIRREQLNSQNKTTLRTTTRLTQTGVKKSQEAISKVATGDIKKIADAFTQVRYYIGLLNIQSRGKPKNEKLARWQIVKANSLKRFISFTKVYNALVQRNRMHKMVIDIAKSITSKKLVLKN